MAMTLLTTNTITSSVASSTFTSGIDGTYKLYLFKFFDCHPATNNVQWGFQGNVAGQSGYNEVITSSGFNAEHDQSDTTATLGYKTALDQAQGTGLQYLTREVGNQGDEEQAAGTLFLFNPSGTTYVKHFYCEAQSYYYAGYTMHNFIGGYFNVTGAIDEIEFKFASGNIDWGNITMYGVG